MRKVHLNIILTKFFSEKVNMQIDSDAFDLKEIKRLTAVITLL